LVFLTAPDGIPLYDGLRLGSEVEPGSFVEIGRPIDAADPDAAQKIAVREAGSARWHARHPSDLGSAFGVASFGLAAQWPADDDAKMVREARDLAASSTLETLLGATFDGASEAFRARVWPEIADRVRAAAASERLKLPAIEGDALRLVEGAVPAGVELLPWTQEGYARFLSLAPGSGLSGYELNAVARLWWGQRIPPEVQRAADATARERRAAEEAAKKAEKGEDGKETPAPATSADEVEPAEAEPAPSAPMSEEGPSLGASIQAAVERRRAQQESEELDRIREAARDPGGYQELVAALGDLAGDIPTASDLATAWPTEWTSIREWIHNYLYSDRTEPEVDARSKRRRARREPVDPSAYDLEVLLTRIRDQIKDVEMRAEDAVEVDQSDGRERLLLRSGYLRGTASAGYYVMREDDAGVSRRYVRVVAGDRIDDDEIEIENIEHRGNEGPPLGPHDALYYYDSDEKDDDFLREIWGLYDNLATTLRKTPLALEQARKCLLLARALIDAPSCQGAAKEEATSLLRTALGYYRQARDRVNQGAFGAAYERLRRVARHVARQSQKLAESCAAGQGGLFGGPAIVDLSRISEEALAESDAAFEAEARAEAGEEADQA
ncbi:MAG: hypothetical protein H6711_35190, partial [Myxococcales bacterium]|nr:hypothetical protein [Myxococcales bacterium]